MRERKSQPEAGDPPWLATFADAMTLLLCFFVLLITFSSMDKEKMRGTLLPMRGALGVITDRMGGDAHLPPDRWSRLSQTKPSPTSKDIPPEREDARQVAALDKLRERVDELRLPHPLVIIPEEEGILVRIDAKVAFGEGEASLSDEAKRVLDFLADFFLKNEGEILVEGFGDGPDSTAEAAGGGPVELSIRRALAAADHVSETGSIPLTRFSISGYGNNLPSPSLAGGLQFLLVRPGRTLRPFASAVMDEQGG